MQTNYRYAKTLFDLCNQSNCISLIQNQLQTIAYLYNKVPAFKSVLITKRLKINDKIGIIRNSLNMFEPLVIEFLLILIKNNQTNNLFNIINKFNIMVKSCSNIAKVHIITAEKLNNSDLEILSQEIFTKLNSKPTINFSIDSKIIGGMKLRIGNKIFDNSVYYQIEQLKKCLHNM